MKPLRTKPPIERLALNLWRFNLPGMGLLVRHPDGQFHTTIDNHHIGTIAKLKNTLERSGIEYVVKETTAVTWFFINAVAVNLLEAHESY